jgi:hypothetical protein
MVYYQLVTLNMHVTHRTYVKHDIIIIIINNATYIVYVHHNPPEPLTLIAGIYDVHDVLNTYTQAHLITAMYIAACRHA